MGANVSSDSLELAGVHQRSSNTYSAFSCSQERRGCGLNAGVRTRWYCSRCPSHWPPMNGMMWSRVQTAARARLRSRPASSASSRRSASSGVSPGSIPPPGVAQSVRPGNSKRTSRIRSSGSITIARAAGRIRSSLTLRALDQLAQRREPAQPLVPRNGGVRGRGRREHEERRLAEPALPGGRAPGAPGTGRGTPPCRRRRSRRAGARARAPRAARRCPRSRPRGGRRSRASCGRRRS